MTMTDNTHTTAPTAPQHISAISDKTAFALALAPMWDDAYHRAIGADAQQLVAAGKGHYRYGGQHAATWWYYDDSSGQRHTVTPALDAAALARAQKKNTATLTTSVDDDALQAAVQAAFAQPYAGVRNGHSNHTTQ